MKAGRDGWIMQTVAMLRALRPNGALPTRSFPFFLGHWSASPANAGTGVGAKPLRLQLFSQFVGGSAKLDNFLASALSVIRVCVYATKGRVAVLVDGFPLHRRRLSGGKSRYRRDEQYSRNYQGSHHLSLYSS